jgi:hypothetical protein
MRFNSGDDVTPDDQGDQDGPHGAGSGRLIRSTQIVTERDPRVEYEHTERGQSRAQLCTIGDAAGGRRRPQRK